MKKHMYAVWDSKVEIFEHPHFLRSRGEAIREWQIECNRAESKICRHPGDYSLFEIGSFDEQTGKIEPHKAPVNLGLALEFKNKSSDEAPLLDRIKKPQLLNSHEQAPTKEAH